MTCYSRRLKDGSILRFRGDLGAHCADCSDIQENLCDYPVGKDKTCDKGVCDNHSNEIAPNTHYCNGHYKLWKEFVDSGGVKNQLENVVPYKQPAPQPPIKE